MQAASFLLPPKNADEARAVIAALEQRLRAAKVELRPPPEAPVACCGRGCAGCVWLAYFDAVRYWRDCAMERLAGVESPEATLVFPLFPENRHELES